MKKRMVLMLAAVLIFIATIAAIKTVSRRMRTSNSRRCKPRRGASLSHLPKSLSLGLCPSVSATPDP